MIGSRSSFNLDSIFAMIVLMFALSISSNFHSSSHFVIASGPMAAQKIPIFTRSVAVAIDGEASI
jgi:hypothetical protein